MLWSNSFRCEIVRNFGKPDFLQFLVSQGGVPRLGVHNFADGRVEQAVDDG
ncbi:MAG: hypothetical protein WA231_08010 [Methylocella sp.]